MFHSSFVKHALAAAEDRELILFNKDGAEKVSWSYPQFWWENVRKK